MRLALRRQLRKIPLLMFAEPFSDALGASFVNLVLYLHTLVDFVGDGGSADYRPAEFRIGETERLSRDISPSWILPG